MYIEKLHYYLKGFGTALFQKISKNVYAYTFLTILRALYDITFFCLLLSVDPNSSQGPWSRTQSSWLLTNDSSDNLISEANFSAEHLSPPIIPLGGGLGLLRGGKGGLRGGGGGGRGLTPSGGGGLPSCAGCAGGGAWAFLDRAGKYLDGGGLWAGGGG